MGTCIRVEESTFLIKKENILKVVEEIEHLAEQKLYRLGHISKGEYEIEEIFEEIGYYLETDDNGDYIIDEKCGEKLNEEFYIFQAIAKYVENSYIEIVSEDGDRWRWIFKNGKCKEVYPKIIWE